MIKSLLLTTFVKGNVNGHLWIYIKLKDDKSDDGDDDSNDDNDIDCIDGDYKAHYHGQYNVGDNDD